MRIVIKREYYKKSRKGKEPIKYHASQPGGVGTDVYATLKLDPVLRKHKDLRESLVNHEKNEIREWGKGSARAHTTARQKEPRLTRDIGGVSGFWQEIDRRKKK